MENYGVFLGRTLIQMRGSIGGSRNVFVKLKGKPAEIYPTNGGEVKNPFKGKAKMFAGDLCEYTPGRSSTDGAKILLLKTYLVESMSTTTLNLINDGFKHKPFVGDVIMKAPSTVDTEGLAVTITAISDAVSNGKKVWQCTISATLTGVVANDILVEGNAAGATAKMLVQNPNAILPCDADFLYEPATGDSDFDGARYAFTPILHNIMWISDMSPIPDCILKFNKSRVKGWFEL